MLCSIRPIFICCIVGVLISASEMTYMYIVSSGALNSTHSLGYLCFEKKIWHYLNSCKGCNATKRSIGYGGNNRDTTYKNMNNKTYSKFKKVAEKERKRINSASRGLRRKWLTKCFLRRRYDQFNLFRDSGLHRSRKKVEVTGLSSRKRT